MYRIFELLWKQGKICAPQGKKIKEIEGFSWIFKPYERFMNFNARKLNLTYIKQEFLWYLRGDQYDHSICQYAKIWGGLINSDGTIYSNYGHYIFKQKQFQNVVRILTEDKDSRRASIVILQPYHLLNDGTKDIPCTYALNFRIRDDYLNMSVNMRSQDAIFGLGNDLAVFSFIHEMVQVALSETYSQLRLGLFFHHVDSFHVYEKHFDMVEKIIAEPLFTSIWCPKISSSAEVKTLLNMGDATSYKTNFQFINWLLT